MIKKIISALCVLFLTFGFVSCQKSKVDQCLDTQTELIETLQKINDKDSADKYAEQIGELTERFITLNKAIIDTPDEKTLGDNPQYDKNKRLLEQYGLQLFFKGYYDSEKLSSALSKQK